MYLAEATIGATSEKTYTTSMAIVQIGIGQRLTAGDFVQIEDALDEYADEHKLEPDSTIVFQVKKTSNALGTSFEVTGHREVAPPPEET